MNDDTFNITLYRKTTRGLEKVTLTVNQEALIISESSSQVESYSKQATYEEFMRMLIPAGNVLRKGHHAEQMAAMQKLRSERVDSSGNRLVTPTPAAIKIAAILTQTPSPCVTEECKTIRAAFDTELESVGGASCPSCTRGGLIAKYQRMLLDKNITG